MNILILHNLYQQRGGEDAVVEAESSLLREAGHKVHVELVSNNVIAGLPAKARIFLRTPFDPSREAWFAALAARLRPDVVHVHNFFPLLTPGIHSAAATLGLPMVQTLHNYRLLCANAQFLRDGAVCEKCLQGTRAWALIHRCYRGSLPGSLALVRMQQRAERLGTWKRVQRFIALTDFARAKFIEGGLPEESLVVKPNFVPRRPDRAWRRQGALFVGRLSPEKGVHHLLEAWQRLPQYPLTIVGDGPERERLHRKAPANVVFTGGQPPEVVQKYMAKAKVLVIPSIWYEGFPMTAVEAFASGLPILASDIGSLSEIIEPRFNGMHFRAGDSDDLARVAGEALADPEGLAELGRGALMTYEAKYTPERNITQLEAIYDEAISAVGR
jgi:glycosyltransferase involved in cell wall biosynthesis